MPKIFKVSFFVFLGIFYSFSSTMAFAKQSVASEGEPTVSKGMVRSDASHQCQ